MPFCRVWQEGVNCRRLPEPQVGGRWYERGEDGSTCQWGSVLSWEPATRLVLSWDITANWQYEPELKTEIEVRFIADGKKGTRVELEHRRLDRYGARRDEMRAIFETQGDWDKLLQRFAQAAAAQSDRRGRQLRLLLTADCRKWF